MAQVSLAAGDSVRALPALRSLAALSPADPRPLFQIGHLLKSTGAANEAREAFSAALAIDPGNVPAMVSLTQVTRFDRHDTEVAMIENRYAQMAPDSEERRHLAFALGKVFDDLQDFDRAFGYLEEGNRIACDAIHSSVRDDENMFESIRSIFSSNFVEHCRPYSVEDASMVFVFGMPRSGTTLVHQIIASHSNAVGGGEMPHMQLLIEALDIGSWAGRPGAETFPTGGVLRERVSRYLRAVGRMRGAASRLVDKSISNVLFAGFIAALLPRAKLISCRRDPRDVCWSIFRRDIPGHEYGYDLERLGRNYQLYLELLDHWETILPGQVCTVHYENLVAEPEPNIRRLIEFCGLPFETDCLDFHRSRQSVATQSTLQVREPIHTGAIGQWRNYEKQLAPLLSMLK